MSLYSDLVEVLTPYANKIKGLAASDDQIRADLSAINTATSDDVGKALKVKTVTNGKVTGWEFGEAGGADPDAIGQAVEDWLDDHPEATTTVPDKSLTINKMVTGTLGYVTPEMYGAVGDGTTNDTSAFSQACNSGKPVVLTEGKTYKIDTVTVTSPLIIIGNFATVSTTSSDSVKSTITIRENAKTVVIGDVNFTTTLGVDTTGAHGEAIPNRSLRTCIASYGVDKLSVINCTFENFDNGIIGITQSSDTVYASVPESLFVKDTKITNCLMGISRHYKNVVIDGCRIQVDTNAQSGEHCVYLLSDVLSNAYITNTTLITDGSSAGACVNIRPRNGEAGANLVDGAYRIDGCTMIGDGYVHVHGGGKCYVTSCTLKTVNYNTTAKIRQFACPSSDDSVIDVSGCSVNLELQDGLTERVIYRGCDIYSGRVFNTRFALYKAYNCQFDNIGINVAEGAEIVECVFSSTSGVAGQYYVLVGSTITASTIIGCTFKTGANVNMIAYNSSGVCLLVAVISSLPNGNNITGLTFYHKINPNEPENGGQDGFSPIVEVTNITGGHRVSITDATGTQTFDVMDGTGGSGGYSPWSSKKVCVFGDSIGAGHNNNNYSFVDILRERGFFASVHKNCVAGTTTSTLHARLIESEAEIAGADIIYCEYEYNDITGLINGNLTPTTLVSSLDTAINYIRARNATCQIVWMPLTISHFDKVGADNVSYFKTWAETMYPAFAERGINLLPVYDEAAAGHASIDGKHPNTAGHRLIAEHVMQLPLGTSNYSTIISDEQGGGSSDQLVTVLYDGNATINTYQGSNYILLNGISDVPAVGDSYRVTWGSTPTMLIAKATTVSGTDYVVIGNPVVVGGTDDDSGLTYVAYKSNATQLQFITTDPTGSIQLKVEKYSVSEATTTSAGLMTAEDKQHLDAVYTDYSDMLALI